MLDALDNITLWLDKDPIRHVKNRYPTETMYGCEGYAYFDKYMITAASFLYVAYLICDDTIEAAPKENRTLAFSLSDHFHKTFLRCDPYFVEIEPYADPHYEACGIGRIHRANAPSEICLTDSCPQEPRYTVDVESPLPFAIAPGIEHDGKWLYALDKTKVIYEPDALDCDDGVARSAFYCRFVNESAHVHMETTVREDGVTIALEGNGKLRCLLPAFCFDGETSPVIRAEAHTLEVAYRGWICRYTTNGVIEELSGIACNRSGHYRPFAATAEDGLSVHVEIVKE